MIKRSEVNTKVQELYEYYESILNLEYFKIVVEDRRILVVCEDGYENELKDEINKCADKHLLLDCDYTEEVIIRYTNPRIVEILQDKVVRIERKIKEKRYFKWVWEIEELPINDSFTGFNEKIVL